MLNADFTSISVALYSVYIFVEVVHDVRGGLQITKYKATSLVPFTRVIYAIPHVVSAFSFFRKMMCIAMCSILMDRDMTKQPTRPCSVVHVNPC